MACSYAKLQKELDNRFQLCDQIKMHATRASVFILLMACGGEHGRTPDAPPDGFDRTALLDHLANKVLLPMQTTVAAKAAALPGAIDAHCDALDAGAPGTALDAARAAWAETIDAWQRAEAALIGPAAMDNKALRSMIYAWPTISTCEIDRDTASRFADPSSYDISTKLIRVRSLYAIEYLLYPRSGDHTCITAPPGWTALGADVPRARCRLAEALAIDVATQTATLEAAWRPDGGDYAGELARAGQSGSSFATAHAAVNVVAGGMFYVDYIVKDMKLGEPAGIADNACGTVGTPCLLELELPFADRATFAVRANLATLREVFTGTTATADGPGFDDFLRALGHGDVADRMTGSLDAAIATAAQLPDSFVGALMNDYQKVVAAHGAARMFTLDLKSQFLTLLALELPNDVPTDND
jgi:predicted lipoprotein